MGDSEEPKSAPTPEPAAPKRVSWLRRTRARRILARLIGWGSVAVVALAFLLYTAARLYLTPPRLAALIKEQVEEQTGGRLELGRVDFNLLSGLKLADVRFYPPLAGDTRGVAHGGEAEPQPLAEFQALELRYSFPKLLAGRAHIKTLALVAPAFHLRQTDGTFNFASILAYRAQHFPPAPKPAEAAKPEAQPKSSGGLLPLSPALLYMPFEILMQDIGIKDLSFDLVQTTAGRVTQVVAADHVSFDMGVHWLGRDSSVWFDLASPFEKPLELSVKQAKGQGPLVQTLAVRTALDLRFELHDFQKVSVDFATRLLALETPLATFKDLGTYFKMRLALADDLKTISFDTFDAELADALAYELRGTVAVSDPDVTAVILKLKQKVNLRLPGLAELARPFVPGLTAAGEVNVEDLTIDGTIEPAQAAALARGEGVPHIAGVVWLEDVMAELPGLGVSMDPVSGSTSFAVGPNINGRGAQVDVSVDMDVPRIDARQTVPKVGLVEAGVGDLVAKVTARFLYPEMIAPIVKMNIEAEHVRASGEHIASLDVPLLVDLDADGRADLARAGVTANVELTDLAEFSGMADCQAKCTRFRANALGRMESLARLHALALPLGALFGAGQFMPTKLTGAVDFEFAAKGTLPDPLTTPVPELLKRADVRFNGQVNLAKLNANVPFMDVQLKNFESRVFTSGTLADQRLDLSQKFDSLTVSVPKGVDQPPLPVAVSRFALETSIDNHIAGPLDLKTVLQQLATAVDSKLYIGKVSAEGALPRPLTEFQFAVSVAQQRLTDIQVKELTVKLPDYGTSVGFAAETSIGPDFMPRRFKATTRTQIVHTGDEHLPLGIKTSGGIDVVLAVDSPDMKTVAVDGRTSFDRFNLSVPGKGEKAPPLLVVEDIRGQIPFKQVVQLPDLSQLKKPAPAAGQAGAAPAPATPAAGATAAAVAATAARLADVPDVAVRAEDDDGKPAGAGSVALDQAMGQYFRKNDNQLAKNTNLVAMVDYGSIRPFYPERQPLSIKRVEAANLELTNLEFDMELRQNWFALNQFVINFLGGKIEGDFQLAFDAGATDPKQIPKTLRTAVHMTRLDTRKLIERFPNLQGKASSWDLFSNPYIDGTVHLAFDVVSSDLSGGVEITSIGKEQLKMMLYYVDPFEQNPTIGDMRKALALGEVRQVSIPLKNGEVGMDMDVRVLSAPVPVPKLTHFPISQIIQNFKDQAMPAQAVPAAGPAAAPASAPTASPAPPPPAANQAQASNSR